MPEHEYIEKTELYAKSIYYGEIGKAVVPIKDIEEMPVVKMPHRIHAHWVECKTADFHWRCSHCGYGYTDNKLTFCYDCGAEMDEVI